MKKEHKIRGLFLVAGWLLGSLFWMLLDEGSENPTIPANESPVAVAPVDAMVEEAEPVEDLDKASVAMEEKRSRPVQATEQVAELVADSADSIVQVIDSTAESELAADSSLLDTSVVAAADTSLVDSVIVNEDERIVVKKDRMVSSIHLSLLKLDKEEDMEADTTLEEMSGIKNTKTFTEYTVEFWESPINYHGYKQANNTIVLFGLDPEQAKLGLMLLDQQLYLNYREEFFVIDPTFAFKSLQKLEDEQTLLQLRQ